MLSKTRFSVLDLETTGLDTKRDEIVSIAIIPMIGTNIWIKDYYSCFVKPKKSNAKAITIHGIDTKTLRNAKTFGEISGSIDAILKDTIMVGCDTGFDVEILRNHFSKINKKVRFEWIDVIQIEKWLCEKNGMSRDFTTLEQLIERYRLEDIYRHSALADTYQAAQIFQFQLKKLMELGIGVKDLLDIGKRKKEFVPLGMG